MSAQCQGAENIYTKGCRTAVLMFSWMFGGILEKILIYSSKGSAKKGTVVLGMEGDRVSCACVY
jgi:hypothetical protein